MIAKMSWWKVLLAWPILIYLFFRSRRLYKASLSKKKSILEQKRYYWINRYSKLLAWFYSVKYHLINKTHWSFNACIIALNDDNVFLPLIFIKANNFKKHPPISFGFPKTFLTKLPRLLKYFYLSLNYFVIDGQNDNHLLSEKIVKNTLIPRSLLFILPLDNQKIINFFVHLVSSSLANLHLINTLYENNKFKIEFNQQFTSKEIMKINNVFLYQKILTFVQNN